MKKIIMGLYIVLGFVGAEVHAARPLLHSLVNNSKHTIAVIMDLHGPAYWHNPAKKFRRECFSCCRRDATLKPGERIEWATGRCQLRRVRVVEEGTNEQASLSVQNASVNVLKDVAAGTLLAVGATVAAVATGGLALGGALAVKTSVAGATAAAIAAKAAAGAATSAVVSAPALGIGGTAFGVSKIVPTYKELVAYGSTAWVYDEDGLRAMSGVKMYQ